jgi:hypothetical protein
MSNQARMTENFYERDDVTFEFIENSDEIIRISAPNPELALLFQRDFSPLCFTTHYENEEDNPSMTPENLFDIHHAASKGCAYNEEHILNHYWIDRVKAMLNWVQGTEVYFLALLEEDTIVIAIYNNPITCSHKIDVDGFYCSRIRIPASRFHMTDTILDNTPKIVTGYQRVVCWYNMNLEDEGSTYIFK